MSDEALYAGLVTWAISYGDRVYPDDVYFDNLKIQKETRFTSTFFHAYFVPITVRFFMFFISECACTLFLEVYSVTIRNGLMVRNQELHSNVQIHTCTYCYLTQKSSVSTRTFLDLIFTRFSVYMHVYK